MMFKLRRGAVRSARKTAPQTAKRACGALGRPECGSALPLHFHDRGLRLTHGDLSILRSDQDRLAVVAASDVDDKLATAILSCCVGERRQVCAVLMAAALISIETGKHLPGLDIKSFESVEASGKGSIPAFVDANTHEIEPP